MSTNVSVDTDWLVSNVVVGGGTGFVAAVVCVVVVVDVEAVDILLVVQFMTPTFLINNSDKSFKNL